MRLVNDLRAFFFYRRLRRWNRNWNRKADRAEAKR